jgi:hypothetical protein
MVSKRKSETEELVAALKRQDMSVFVRFLVETREHMKRQTVALERIAHALERPRSKRPQPLSQAQGRTCHNVGGIIPIVGDCKFRDLSCRGHFSYLGVARLICGEPHVAIGPRGNAGGTRCGVLRNDVFFAASLHLCGEGTFAPTIGHNDSKYCQQ